MSKIFECLSLLCLTACIFFGIHGEAFAQTGKPPTAQPEVSLLPEQLAMPGLDRTRQIRIYVPPGYATSTKRYPVLYMHDGQNLFDDATSFAGEWQVDETLNALSRSGKLELIVVGIDNGKEKRMSELNPFPNPRFGRSEGKEYMEFVVRVLKPLIDKQYRTKADRAHTAIMGSSLGGLISHYAIVQYPEVFSKAGIFSPAYWVAESSFEFFATKPAAKDARLYFLAGEKEGDSMIPDLENVYASVLKTGHPTVNAKLKIIPGAHHNEALWRSEFEQAVLWLFSADAAGSAK
jgi:predicted alpha/beta superfamily hydrolase